MELEFAKMSGAGNDFVVIDNRQGAIGQDVRELAKQLCRRRMSIGADGLILVGESRDHAFRMRYFNADGSEADMCGNGGRCVARFASELGIAEREIKFESRIGIHKAEARDDGNVKLGLPDPRAVLLKTAPLVLQRMPVSCAWGTIALAWKRLHKHSATWASPSQASSRATLTSSLARPSKPISARPYSTKGRCKGTSPSATTRARRAVISTLQAGRARTTAQWGSAKASEVLAARFSTAFWHICAVTSRAGQSWRTCVAC